MNLVYIHYYDNEDEPFYCGSGVLGREHCKKRNRLWKEMVKDNPNYNVRVLLLGDSKLCLDIETELTLDLYSKGFCQANIQAGDKWLETDHISGVNSHLHGKVARNKGVPHTDEAKAKMKGCPTTPQPGEANGMYGKDPWNKGMTKEEMEEYKAHKRTQR